VPGALLLVIVADGGSGVAGAEAAGCTSLCPCFAVIGNTSSGSMTGGACDGTHGGPCGPSNSVGASLVSGVKDDKCDADLDSVVECSIGGVGVGVACALFGVASALVGVSGVFENANVGNGCVASFGGLGEAIWASWDDFENGRLGGGSNSGIGCVCSAA